MRPFQRKLAPSGQSESGIPLSPEPLRGERAEPSILCGSRLAGMLGRLYSWAMIFSSGAATSSDAHLTYAGSFKLGLMFYYDDVEIVNPLPHAGNISFPVVWALPGRQYFFNE